VKPKKPGNPDPLRGIKKVIHVMSNKGDRMIRKIAFLAIVSLVLSVGVVYAASPEKEKAAVSSAEKWLGMIDEGKYAESWKGSAELFRNALTQDLASGRSGW
jgi:hypothetical protein